VKVNDIVPLLGGGAVGMSLSPSFEGEWTPLLVAGGLLWMTKGTGGMMNKALIGAAVSIGAPALFERFFNKGGAGVPLIVKNLAKRAEAGDMQALAELRSHLAKLAHEADQAVSPNRGAGEILDLSFDGDAWGAPAEAGSVSW